jgi:hypothetical protein
VGDVFLATAVSAVEGWFVDGEEWIVRGRRNLSFRCAFVSYYD